MTVQSKGVTAKYKDLREFVPEINSLLIVFHDGSGDFPTGGYYYRPQENEWVKMSEFGPGQSTKIPAST